MEKRHRPTISSSLRGNRTGDWKSLDFYPSKRHSTPASEKPKRTATMKLMNSTAANRVIKNKRKVQKILTKPKTKKKLLKNTRR